MVLLIMVTESILKEVMEALLLLNPKIDLL